ncbi:MAG: hypothetical protein MUE40_19445, partial [Anaerolineae bacterium]|nr:hypothetical protein [Anaerolineae bacterium]
MLLIVVLLLPGSLARAQNAQPAITDFSSNMTAVDRAALAGRTARVPVRWNVVNRPLLANLIFEQVLPDNSVINVELPRVIPWVNSSGDGIAAPILPAASATEIRLRVRLAHIITGTNYAVRELVLPTGNNGAGRSGGGAMPTISSFTTSFTGRLKAADLSAGTLRLPVAWSVIHRPTTATLVFEQIMPDNRAVNVELPRSNPWVNSSDQGVVAPRLNTGDTSSGEIRLRLSLVDVLYGRIYDRRELMLPVETAAAPATYFRSFTTPAAGVSAARLAGGSEQVPVAWELLDRPPGTNLVFEQVLSNGTVRNAELPRQVALVPSSGQGIVALIPPGGTSVTFRVRLVDLNSGSTLDMRSITLPVQADVREDVREVNGSACYAAPFPTDGGLAVGQPGRVLPYYNNAPLAITRDRTTPTVTIGQLNTGDTVTVLAGPVCLITSTSDGATLRLWRMRTAAGLEGWIQEYTGTAAGGFIRQMAGTAFA